MKVKTYTITLSVDDEGKATLNRTNDGFNLLELLGICTLILKELTDVQNGSLKVPIDKIERNVIVNKADSVKRGGGK